MSITDRNCSGVSRVAGTAVPTPAFVDEDVDSAERLHGGVDLGAAVLWTGHVGAYGDGPTTGVFDQLAGGGQPILSTRGQ